MEEDTKKATGAEELRIIRTFMDLLSHDINNHLYGATGYLELLGTMVRGDETKERFLRSSLTEVRAIAALVENLRLLTMLSSEPFAPEPVDLRTRLSVAEESVRYYLGDRDLELAVDRASPDVKLRADRFLHDVLVQVLSNSIRNDPSPAILVVIRWAIEGDNVELTMEDYGRGMNDGEKSASLSRYSRLTKEGNVQGKGIGLSLVRAVMERYGGGIRLEDRIKGKPSKGLKVVLTVPLWRD